MRVKLVELDGTPDEIKQVSHLFGGVSEHARSDSPAPNASGHTKSANGASVTVDHVLHVLTRRELHTNVKKALKALSRSGQKGMSTEEIASAVGIDRGQLAGVFGAFGRRVANTKGWPAGADIITYRRDEKGRKRYYLEPVVQSALEKLSL